MNDPEKKALDAFLVIARRIMKDYPGGPSFEGWVQAYEGMARTFKPIVEEYSAALSAHRCSECGCYPGHQPGCSKWIAVEAAAARFNPRDFTSALGATLHERIVALTRFLPPEASAHWLGTHPTRAQLVSVFEAVAADVEDDGDEGYRWVSAGGREVTFGHDCVCDVCGATFTTVKKT